MLLIEDIVDVQQEIFPAEEPQVNALFDCMYPEERRRGRRFTSEEIISFGKNPELLNQF